MVTSYYIMKMTQKSGMDLNEYYNKLHVHDLKKSLDNSNSICRICLKDGSLPIFSVENSSQIVEALQIFGNIEISQNDEYPKNLCYICHRFIKSAISFRKVAQESDEVLRRPLKDEIADDFQDSHDIEEEPDLYPIDKKMHETHLPAGPVKRNKEKVKSAKVQCYVCQKVVTRAYYKEHITMHDPNHQKYVCDICGKSFRLRCAYHNHSLRHRTDFPFKCQFCPYKGKYSELLRTHMRTHTGDYRYMCTECPARFLFKSNFNRHVLIKHNIPQHKCEECKKMFHTKLMLQRHHESQHLGIKNHVCNVCGKAFGYRSAMMKHQRHVHKREKSLHSRRMPNYMLAEIRNVGTGVM